MSSSCVICANFTTILTNVVKSAEYPFHIWKNFAQHGGRTGNSWISLLTTELNSPRKLYVQKGGKMDMSSLMGSIKDRTSKEFLEMQSFQLEKTWVCLSWPWQAGDGLYSTLLERHQWCRSWCAHNYPTILQFFGRLLLGIIMCPSRLQINWFIFLLGRLRLSGDLPL